MNHYYEVRVECFNTKGQIYLAERFRYTNKLSAQNKAASLKRHHPWSRIELVKRKWGSKEGQEKTSEASPDTDKPQDTTPCLLAALIL